MAASAAAPRPLIRVVIPDGEVYSPRTGLRARLDARSHRFCPVNWVNFAKAEHRFFAPSDGQPDNSFHQLLRCSECTYEHLREISAVEFLAILERASLS